MASEEKANVEAGAEKEEIELFTMVKEFGFLFLCFLLGYLIGYWGFSIWWLTTVAFLWVIRRKYSRRQQSRVEFHRAVAEDEKNIIKCSVKDLPSWVFFPDTERAEWFNKILKQMWPFVGDYVRTMLTTKVQQNIDDALPDYCKGFRFEKIDLGTVPLRLASVKCYDENTARDEIILDLELIYAGNCDVQVKMKGFGAGIKDFQLYGTLRVELKPLIKDMPLIACVSCYFLNNPVIEMNFTNFAEILDIPGLSEMLRRAIKENFAKVMVLPNKFVFPLVDDFKTKTIKFNQPIGLVRLELIEAKQLKKADVGMLGLGKSDPYVNIIIGSQEFRTFTIYNTVNPKWNFICETLAYFSTQSIDLEVMDEDQGSKDDFLGKVSFPLDSVTEEGVVDAWINLRETKTGRVHIRCTWIALEHSTEHLQAQKMLSKTVKNRYLEEHQDNPLQYPFGTVACLLVYLDCGKNLPSSTKSIGEPSPQVILKLRNQKEKSIVKSFTSNPIWEENFNFLLDEYNPHDELMIDIVDTKTKQKIGNASVMLKAVSEKADMTYTDPIVVRHYSHNFDLYATLSLWFLHSPNINRMKIVRDETVEEEESAMPTMEDIVMGTVEPFAKISGIEGDLIEMSQQKRHTYQKANGSEKTESLEEDKEEDEKEGSLAASVVSELEAEDSSMIEVTINKLVDLDKMEIIVHKAVNLRKVNGKLPDPYVKLYKMPGRKQSFKDKSQKTFTIKNTCNPIFEESFFVEPDDIADSIKLVVYSHTTSGLFKKNKEMLGFVEIAFNEKDLKDNTFTKWYELEQFDD